MRINKELLVMNIIVFCSFASLSHGFQEFNREIKIDQLFNELQGQVGYQGTDVKGQSNSIDDLESQGMKQKESNEIFSQENALKRQQKLDETGFNRNNKGFLDKALHTVKNADKEFDYLKSSAQVCSPTEETVTDSSIESCDQFYQMEEQNCFPRQVVEIDPKYHYQCSQEQVIKRECTQQNFCIGDTCKSKQRSQHNDFSSSISYLNILAGMKSTDLEGCKCPGGKSTCSPNEIDTRNCKFFTGNSGTCRNHHGQFNCCRVKGIIPDVFGCKQDEKDLQQKRKAGLCHHVGSWKKKKWGLFNKKYESYCCFKSKMARIIQVEGRKQLGMDFGDKHNPDCRALTLDELKRIDFTKINFGELFRCKTLDFI